MLRSSFSNKCKRSIIIPMYGNNYNNVEHGPDLIKIIRPTLVTSDTSFTLKERVFLS